MRFGVFELDARAGELRKSGVKVRLQEQPLQILTLLLDRPGAIVTRDEIRRKLWPDGTYVDFDHSLNAAVMRLREALDDSADNPRFIETVPRRGYRFLAPVQPAPGGSDAAPAVAIPSRRKLRPAVVTAVALLSLLALTLGLNLGGLRDRLFAPPSPAPQIRSLAVLPFKNLMGDPEQSYFVEGMHEQLTSELSKISALKVISRTSTLGYKQTGKRTPQIARELGVEGLIEGSVMREGNQVRISVQLIHGPSDRHLWARSFDRDLPGILLMYREVARAITTEINIALTPAEKTRLAASRTVHPEAHDAFLKGSSIWGQREKGSARRSMEYFQQAVALDPNYALAYARLARAHNLVAGKEHFRKAKEAALKALELDDQVAEAYAALALISDFYDWDWAAAEKYARRALELDPNSASSHHVYALYLSSMGRHDEAIAEMQRAAEIEPLIPLTILNLAKVYLWAKQYDRARQVMQNCVELDPQCAADAHVFSGMIYAEQGQYQQALEEFEEFERIAGCCLFQKYLLHARMGRKSEARAALNEMKAEADRGEPTSGLAVARLHAALGDREEAFVWLEKAYQDRNRDMGNLKEISPSDPLHPLRDDPRFQDLLRRMNFPD